MLHSCTYVIILRCKEYLRFVFKSAISFGVHNTHFITLKRCAKVAFFTSCDEESRQALCRELNRQFEARRYPVRARFTEADIVVVADAVVTKMTGVERLCRILGCSVRDVVAIGDGDNDVEMLAGCGLGIAVANATPAAKAQATHLVRSNDDAGVAQAVDMIIRGELP